MDKLVKEGDFTQKVMSLIQDIVSAREIDAVNNFTKTDVLNNSDVDQIGAMFGYKNGVPFSSMDDAKKTRLITSFKKNLSLLVQKTWIEETDSALKEEVLYKLDKLFSGPTIDWVASYSRFLDVIKKSVFLMFGEQFEDSADTSTLSSNFCEYALRIDGNFGVFCWYITMLPKTPAWSADKCHAALLLGMWFIANY